MRDRMVSLVKNVSSWEIRRVLREHGVDVVVNSLRKTAEIIVDKTYAMRYLMRSAQLKHLLDGVERIYWEWFKTSLKVHISDSHHDREMNIPRVVHY